MRQASKAPTRSLSGGLPPKTACVGGNGGSKEFDDADDFDQDEFADDDFADDSAFVADDVPFSLSPNMEAP